MVMISGDRFELVSRAQQELYRKKTFLRSALKKNFNLYGTCLRCDELTPEMDIFVEIKKTSSEDNESESFFIACKGCDNIIYPYLAVEPYKKYYGDPNNPDLSDEEIALLVKKNQTIDLQEFAGILYPMKYIQKYILNHKNLFFESETANQPVYYNAIFYFGGWREIVKLPRKNLIENWEAKCVGFVGKLPDSYIGAVVGVPDKDVQQLREDLEIEPFLDYPAELLSAEEEELLNSYKPSLNDFSHTY